MYPGVMGGLIPWRQIAGSVPALLLVDLSPENRSVLLIKSFNSLHDDLFMLGIEAVRERSTRTQCGNREKSSSIPNTRMNMETLPGSLSAS